VTEDLDFSRDEAIRLAQLAVMEINVSDQDLPSISDQAWIVLQAYNTPPWIFRYGDLNVRLEENTDSSVGLSPMTLDRMRHALARAASWYRFGRGKTSNTKIAVYPPMEVIRDLLATPNAPLPVWSVPS
jgi:hypothetical protein